MLICAAARSLASTVTERCKQYSNLRLHQVPNRTWEYNRSVWSRAIAVAFILTVACGAEPAKETVPAPVIETKVASGNPPDPSQTEGEKTAAQAEPAPTNATEPAEQASVVLSQLEQEEQKRALGCKENSDCVLHTPCCSCGGRQVMNAQTAAGNRENCKRRLCSACAAPAPAQQDVAAVCEAGLCVSKPASASQ